MQQMKLSDAIMLGSMMIKWVAGTRRAGDGGGCALGMADAAIGRCHGGSYPVGTRIHLWLAMAHHCPLPCNCQDSYLIGSHMTMLPRDVVQASAAGVLVHLFNYHVMTAKDWTLEQLVDWVRSIEPPFAEAVQEEVEMPAPACVAE